MRTKQEIEKLSSLPILGVAASLGIEIDRNGLCLCPMHNDKNPSMKLYTASNSFFCFACCRSGGVIDLVEHKLGLGFKEACHWLESNSNIILSEQHPERTSFSNHERDGPKRTFNPDRYSRYFEHPMLSEKAREFLFAERRLNPKVIEWCRISSWCDKSGTQWLQTPFYDTDGRLIGVQWRNLSNNEPRFRYPAGSRCHIYNLPIMNHLKQGEPLYIAEGCSDCWSLLSSGLKAIAIPSATMMTQACISQLSDISRQLSTEFHIYPDNDEPGKRLYRQLCSMLPVVRHTLREGCKDFSEYYLLTK